MTGRRQFLTAATATVAAVALGAAALPGPAAAAERIYVERGFAIRGTDPIAYFTEGRPVPGEAGHEVEWQGVRWRFASAENRGRFLADPAAFAPQYGGYCAWAAAEGYLAPTDPAAWSIVDGRLYLNASARVHRRWLRDVPGNIARADVNWPRIGRVI